LKTEIYLVLGIGARLLVPLIKTNPSEAVQAYYPKFYVQGCPLVDQCQWNSLGKFCPSCGRDRKALNALRGVTSLRQDWFDLDREPWTCTEGLQFWPIAPGGPRIFVLVSTTALLVRYQLLQDVGLMINYEKLTKLSDYYSPLETFLRKNDLFCPEIVTSFGIHSFLCKLPVNSATDIPISGAKVIDD
jgi:hypothetical protein